MSRTKKEIQHDINVVSTTIDELERELGALYRELMPFINNEPEWADPFDNDIDLDEEE